MKKIEDNNLYGYIYYFEYGKTEDEYSPEPIYGSNNPHYYLYLDQDTINKPVEISPKNVFKISDYAKNITNDRTPIATRIAGKKRKSRKSKKSRKPRRKTMRHKKKSRH